MEPLVVLIAIVSVQLLIGRLTRPWIGYLFTLLFCLGVVLGGSRC